MALISNLTAGELCDSMEGRQRYALIDGDQIISLSYEANEPDDGRRWLPVHHFDSEPFDRATHWRLKPAYEIENDRVVCTYPVVLKTMEHC